MILHPVRALKIISLYKSLKGKYRFIVISSHAYKEAFYKKRKVLKNNYVNVRNQIDKSNLNNQQIVISIHDGLLRSGGLTDRLKGICTLYMFAKNQNFTLKIYFVYPFILQKYLVPNIYDWTIHENELSYDLNTTAIYTWENIKLVDDFFRLNSSKEQLHISCNSGECFDNYSELFHELFKPSSFLATKIKLHSDELGGSGNYISITFRFQNLLGEFAEGNSTSLSKKERKLLIRKCLNGIVHIRNQHMDIGKILVTSDSNIFREIATNAYPFIYTYIVPEEIGHIDYIDVGKGKELTAFLDMFLISGAKKAYQIRSAEMYNSDFPNMAAKINNVPYEMILIN